MLLALLSVSFLLNISPFKNHCHGPSGSREPSTYGRALKRLIDAKVTKFGKGGLALLDPLTPVWN